MSMTRMTSAIPFFLVKVVTTVLLVSRILLLCSSSSSGFLDLEELKSSFYSVKILDTPTTVPELKNLKTEEATVHVSSKYGQRYICHYKRTPTANPVESDDKVVELNITDILEPMRGYCIVKTKDWWTYQFCYGEDITQFHLENGKKIGDIISLGKYDSDKEWLLEDLKELKKSAVNRYHTQKYLDGTVCDLTKKPRKSEVRFSCVEGEVDHIGAVAELESCSYIIFIYTSKICHHPYLRPPTQATASVIECQPVVTQGVYEHYISQLESEKETDDLQANAENVDSVPTGTTGVDALLKSLLKDVSAPDVEPAKVKETVEYSVPTTTISDKLAEQKRKLMEMLAEAMADNNGKNTVKKYKETIRKYVSAQFDEIITEAKAELAADGGDESIANSVAEIEQLKSVMTTVLDNQLNALEDLESSSTDDEDETTDAQSDDEKELNPQQPSKENEKPPTDPAESNTEKQSTSPAKPKLTKPSREIKIEFIQPQQLEVEMIDIDDIDESSELYGTAKQAKKQQADKDNKQLKTVIAVLRPMQEKGTRQEERKHRQLQDNYGKRWDQMAHDEL